MSDPVDYVPFETTISPPAGAAADPAQLDRLSDVPVEVAVEIGRTRMTIREALALGPGSIITLDRFADQPVDLLVNGKRVAVGEVVVIDEEYGLRVTQVVAADAGEGSGHAVLPAAADEALQAGVEAPAAP
jgi:flagellar motor switch protein FliN/FliY